eukprot:COSAG05_NODE_1197_length_5557_cov_6.456761_4_plen_48_part_00
MRWLALAVELYSVIACWLARHQVLASSESSATCSEVMLDIYTLYQRT